jgi:hypothetical protein
MSIVDDPYLGQIPTDLWKPKMDQIPTDLWKVREDPTDSGQQDMARPIIPSAVTPKPNPLKSAQLSLNGFCTFATDEDFIQMTQWYNDEGYDITVSSKSAGEQQFKLTYGELMALINLFTGIGSI